MVHTYPPSINFLHIMVSKTWPRTRFLMVKVTTGKVIAQSKIIVSTTYCTNNSIRFFQKYLMKRGSNTCLLCTGRVIETPFLDMIAKNYKVLPSKVFYFPLTEGVVVPSQQFLQ